MTIQGIDPVRMAGAFVSNLRGKRRYLEGASTLTQQLARNFFLTEALAREAATGQRSWRRKLLEQFMSLILERKATKNEILELYLNDVYLGQRGSFAVHGVAEASRLFFGKDVSNISLAEAATIAGTIQSPAVWSPFHSPERARERRNVVLRAMADAGFISAPAASRVSSEPVQVVQRALESQAPYFVDLVGQTLAEQLPGLAGVTSSLDVYTTLDIHLQRVAQDVLRQGIVRVDEILARRKRHRQAQAALIAVDPRTGDVLALVGGRSYNQSQYNRAVAAKRQPGSVFKPFVYLAAFERAAAEGRGDITPATLVMDEPTMFDYDEGWNPRQLRGRVRRGDHVPPCAGDVAQHRHHPRRRARRVQQRCAALGQDRRRHPATRLSRDYPGRVRGIALRHCHRVHDLSERRGAAAAAGAHPRHQWGHGAAPHGRRAPPRGETGHHVPGHQHDAECHQRGHGGFRARVRLCVRCALARRAPPTISGTPGSWASRRNC